MDNEYPRLALAIGIDAYPHARLPYCIKDASEVAAYLELDEYGFKATVVADPTKGDLREAIHSFFRQPASFYVFYYSGHAFGTEYDAYFLTPDVDSPEDGIAMSHLNRVLDGLGNPGAPLLIILDCCHAGALQFGEKPTNYNCATRQQLHDAINTLGSSRALLASCSEDQKSTSVSSDKHSLFSYYLIEGLAGASADTNGNVTISRLHADIEEGMSQRGAQTPILKGDIMRRMILGTGLSPCGPDEASTSDKKKIAEYEAEATQLQLEIKEILQDCGNDPRRWASTSFLRASEALPDRLVKFEKRSADKVYGPALKHSGPYSGAHAYATFARKQLAENLSIDVVTRRGKIKEFIGSGGFGKVWLVEDEGGSEWAYKVCHSQIFDQYDKVQRFRLGFHAMERLSHPNIVRVTPLDYTEAPLGFFMEYVPGPNWRDFSPANTMSREFRTIVQHLIKIAQAVAFAHSHPSCVLHRDIKPENILVGYDDNNGELLEPKLADFDLAWYSYATTIESKSLKSQVMTYNYASPEFRRNPDSVDARKPTTDIFSFGQLVYFAFTNTDPDPRNQDTSLLEEKLGGWCPTLHAARQILALFKDCTAKAISNRVQSMEEVVSRLIEIDGSILLLQEKAMTQQFFLEQLAFSVRGLRTTESLGRNEVAVATPSGRYSIDMSIKTGSSGKKTVNLRFRCHAMDIPVVSGAQSFNEAKQRIYGALNKSARPLCKLSKFNMVREDTIGFDATIYLDDAPLTSDGLREATTVLKAVSHELDRN